MGTLLKILLVVVLVWHNLAAAPRKPRLSVAAQNPSYYLKDVNGISGTYSFGYDIFDPYTGNTQFRTEERYANGTVIGSYGYIDPRGKSQRFNYVADENGYRVLHGGSSSEKLKQSSVQFNSPTEPTVTWSRPRKPHTKNKGLKIPSNVLQPPHFSLHD